jgi:hypothetical protein
MRKLMALTLMAGFAGTALPAAAQPVAAPNGCFLSSQFENWKAPDDKTIIIRVNMNRYYRLDLSAACPELRWPSVHLVTKVTGSDWICSANDWDLQVSENEIGSPGVTMACIVKSMTALSPAEVAAIPPKYKP